jgi:hypothetical protein
VRIVDSTVAMLLGAAMLVLPGAGPKGLADGDSGLAASVSAAASASAPADAVVSLTVDTELDPVRNWSIAVIGGIASTKVVTVPDPTDGSGTFSVAVFGASATVQMRTTLPVGLELNGTCFDHNDQVQHKALAPPRTLVVEVVAGHEYDCNYGTALATAGEPTAPATDLVARVPTAVRRPHDWMPVVAFAASLIAALGLISARARLRSRRSAGRC